MRYRLALPCAEKGIVYLRMGPVLAVQPTDLPRIRHTIGLNERKVVVFAEFNLPKCHRLKVLHYVFCTCPTFHKVGVNR